MCVVELTQGSLFDLAIVIFTYCYYCYCCHEKGGENATLGMTSLWCGVCGIPS